MLTVMENTFLREITCEDFGEGQITLKGFHRTWHNKPLEIEGTTWLCSGDPLPPAIYLFQFQTEKEKRCSHNYPIIQYGDKKLNIIAHGWNETDPKPLQSFIDIWRKLNNEDCYDDLLAFLNSNPSFPIDMMFCYVADSSYDDFNALIDFWDDDYYSSANDFFDDFDFFNWNLLFKCVYFGREKCIKLLVKKKANPKFTTLKGSDINRIIFLSKNNKTGQFLEQAKRELSSKD